MPRPSNRTLIHPIIFNPLQPSVHILPLVILWHEIELQHELHRERHHNVGRRHRIADKVTCPIGCELGVKIVKVLGGISTKLVVVLGCCFRGDAADVEGNEAVLGGRSVISAFSFL